jgi:hypothetical protein
MIIIIAVTVFGLGWTVGWNRHSVGSVIKRSVKKG